VTFARLLLEIRRRAADMPQDFTRATALRTAVLEAINRGAEAEPGRTVLAALVGVREHGDFDPSILDQLTPEDVLRLDLIAGEIIDQGREQEALRAIRASLIRPVQ
jgi:hypothetical protein